MVFLDRDGVINESPGPGRYVCSVREFAFRKGALAMLAALVTKGYRLVVVTNQQGVGKGIIEPDELILIHDHMRGEMERAGASVAGIYYCPHRETDGCACRKPKPGLIFKAIDAQDRAVDLDGSWFVGDSARDIQAGQAAGLRTIWVGPRSQRNPTPFSPTPTFAVDKICDVAETIFSNE